MEGDLIGRQPQWKLSSLMEDKLNAAFTPINLAQLSLSLAILSQSLFQEN
jgi:hypothetical protein